MFTLGDALCVWGHALNRSLRFTLSSGSGYGLFLCNLCLRGRYWVCLLWECKRCMSMAGWHMINVRSAAACPRSSVSSRWPLSYGLFLSSSNCCSLLCLCHPFYPRHPSSLIPLSSEPPFKCCVLCMCIHARPRTLIQSRVRTPLCLYLIMGSITGDIFPDNATGGVKPGKAEWERADLYPSSHGSHTTATPTGRNEWISYISLLKYRWPPDASLSVSLLQEVFMFCFFSLLCP